MTQLNLFGNLQENSTKKSAETTESRQILEDLFTAYYDARRNKRNSINQLKFEINYESDIFQIYDEIISRTYKPKPSICFIVNDPVQREILAADFRDRVVHHLIFNYINPLFERIFINDSYSCRKGKGTSYGINRLQHFIRSCSENYTKECYILKLDIKGYFMSINKQILYEKIKSSLSKFKTYIVDNKLFDYETVLYLIETVIFNDPTKDCIIKGKKTDWNNLPPSKSLFHSPFGVGLPIGNLTSQLFSNIYLNDFDHFIKCHLKCQYYGRYVDDFVIVHPSKEYLKQLLPRLTFFLQTTLQLTLHPKKIYLQDNVKGVKFLAVIIKPYIGRKQIPQCYPYLVPNGTKKKIPLGIKYW